MCEITIDGKDVQQSGQAAAAMVGVKIWLEKYFENEWFLGETQVHQ